jgi:hypothetical protein
VWFVQVFLGERTLGRRLLAKSLCVDTAVRFQVVGLRFALRASASAVNLKKFTRIVPYEGVCTLTARCRGRTIALLDAGRIVVPRLAVPSPAVRDLS